jgi:uncharacterized protein
MNDKPRLFNMGNESPVYQLFVSLMIIAGVGFVLAFILAIAGVFISGSDLSALSSTSALTDVKNINLLRYLLIVQDVSVLLVPSVIILLMLKPQGISGMPELRTPDMAEIILVVLMTICLFPVTGFAGEINSALHFPSWLSGVGKWVTEKEMNADDLIGSMIDSHTFGILLLNIATLAILPAISEEFIFRGVFQRIFARLFRSGHVAIWVTAVIFSAIHLQFFGFLPRLILGLAFGYLYNLSGTLWLPVTAHFINNAIPVILSYSRGMDALNATPDIPFWKQAVSMPVPMAIILIIFFWFRKRNSSRLL